MYWMFAGSSALELDVSSFDTSNVKVMRGTFMAADATKILGIEKLKTQNVTDMAEMFASSKLEEVNVSNFDTSNVKNMNAMFSIITYYGYSQVTNLKKIIGLKNFNTANVTNMCSMFANSKVTELDVSNFNTSNVTCFWGMFKK